MPSVVITGASGGLGLALKQYFYERDWTVIAIDKHVDERYCHSMLQYDLSEVVNDASVSAALSKALEGAGKAEPIKGFIHNAGLQITGSIKALSVFDIQKSLDVNVLSGFVISQMLIETLTEQNGSILNIGSIHAQQTKKQFAAYSISKTCLLGLTKALSLELGHKIKVNSLEPAAIATPMLKAGFDNDEDRYQTLENFHPTQSIAQPSEIAELAFFMLNNNVAFLNGANIEVDGGISKVLHDPE